MHADVIRHIHLPNLPSASGIERVGESLYIVGDDSPQLYQLDLNWNVIRTHALFETNSNFTGRIPKAAKPDLEAMTSLTWQGRTLLLIIGSGSKSPERDRGFLVDVGGTDGGWRVLPISLTPLYDSLRARADVVGLRALNIEAAAGWGDSVVLFQRGNVSGIHSVVYLDAMALMRHWLEGDELPAPRVCHFELPRLHGVPSGFSGATNTPDRARVLVTASVEDTADEILDGPTLGSFVGWLPGFQMSSCSSSLHPTALSVVKERGWVYDGKIESITLLPAMDRCPQQAIAVVDDDLGGSDLLLLELTGGHT